MANALNQNLQVGQPVVLNDGRIVYCKGGFGMQSFTSGTAIFGRDKDGNRLRISGYDIKRLVEKNE